MARRERALELVQSWGTRGIGICCYGLQRELRAGTITPQQVYEHLNSYVTEECGRALRRPKKRK